MRIKRLFTTASILLCCLFSATNVFGGDEWTMQISVKVRDAQNRLIIGQKKDAIDDMDGRYDVPALLGGDIAASSYLEGDHYWKDIRKTCDSYCRKTWSISIKSAMKGKVVRLKWDPSDIPRNTNIILIDKSTGVVTDMLSNKYEYTYKNSGAREFSVVAESRKRKK